ncbi:MAG TPA: CarD family transcriptional regulator [Pyrinomonadaceae bacterium]|nr:CarD family transcriptional regulator [Pyrinomonadaceae bacterium]
MIKLVIGQKVAYPNQGVCVVESHSDLKLGDNIVSGFSLRLLGDRSTIFVPDDSAQSLGIRPIFNSRQCRELLADLEKDFDNLPADWKSRSKEFIDKVRSGDLFQIADVLKKLTYLSRVKKLSFREQTLLDKARFLIVSELANARVAIGKHIDSLVEQLVDNACSKHVEPSAHSMSTAAH